MADVREAIIARLVAIAQTLAGAPAQGLRNVSAISETLRPAIIVFDGDEEADENQMWGRGWAAPQAIIMTPEIVLFVGGKPEDVGGAMNALRATLIKAIRTDETLKGIMQGNGEIRYAGCSTSVASERTVAGDMGLRFSFRYVLKPSDL